VERFFSSDQTHLVVWKALRCARWTVTRQLATHTRVRPLVSSFFPFLHFLASTRGRTRVRLSRVRSALEETEQTTAFFKNSSATRRTEEPLASKKRKLHHRSPWRFKFPAQIQKSGEAPAMFLAAEGEISFALIDPA